MPELARERTATDAPEINLFDFLRARLDEEEQAAWAAAAEWTAQLAAVPEPLRQQMVRHSPDRVLADVEARRVIVRRFEQLKAVRQELQSSPPTAIERVTLSEVVWHLATVYADHPDYRDVWSNPYVRDPQKRAPLPT